MALSGHPTTCRFMSAIGGKADIVSHVDLCPLMTLSGHWGECENVRLAAVLWPREKRKPLFQKLLAVFQDLAHVREKIFIKTVIDNKNSGTHLQFGPLESHIREYCMNIPKSLLVHRSHQYVQSGDRSGSTLVCEDLRNNNLGWAEEYFIEFIIKDPPVGFDLAAHVPKAFDAGHIAH